MSNPRITEIGKETRFKPGETGNPNGRPKGSKNLKTMLIELLSAQDSEGEHSRPIVMQLFRKAFRDGDMRALQEIIERIEGKVANKIEGTGVGNKIINIVYGGKNQEPKRVDSNTRAIPRELPQE